MERLIRSPALREQMGRMARRHYEEHHAPERMASAILAIYTQVRA